MVGSRLRKYLYRDPHETNHLRPYDPQGTEGRTHRPAKLMTGVLRSGSIQLGFGRRNRQHGQGDFLFVDWIRFHRMAVHERTACASALTMDPLDTLSNGTRASREDIAWPERLRERSRNGTNTFVACRRVWQIERNADDCKAGFNEPLIKIDPGLEVKEYHAPTQNETSCKRYWIVEPWIHNICPLLTGGTCR